MALSRTAVRAAATKLRTRSSDDRRPDDRQPGDKNVSTYLVIPYFAGDRGRPGIERPLPASVIGWLCPSIVVNGQPGKNEFKRGQPTTVTVEVGNYGAGTLTAPVYVRVWWSDPATGFTTLNLFGQATLPVPNGTVQRTKDIVGVIPPTAPTHVCLLAHIWSPVDVGSSSPTPNPTSDRHWAQLNINEIAVAPGQPFQFMFWAGNPFKEGAEIEVSVTNLGRESARTMERLRRTEIAHFDAVDLQLRDAGLALAAGERSERGEARMRLSLRGGERRPLIVIGKLPEGTDKGLALVEIKSISHSHDGLETGSIGLLVHTRR